MNEKRSSRTEKRVSRSGFSLVEAMIGISALAICTLMIVPMLQGQAAWRQELRREQFARITLQNLATQLQADPPDEVTEEALGPLLEMTSERVEVFPEGKIEAEVSPESDPPGDRVRLRLSWGKKGESSRFKVELVTWVFKRGGGP